MNSRYYSNLKYFAVVAAMVGTVQFCATGPPAEDEGPSLTEEERARIQLKCDIALSNAWEYFKNRDYNSSVRNYLNLIELGCGEEYAQNVYVYFGRAYLELSNPDSAIWAFQQGLRYLPEDKDLLQNAAYTMGRLGQVDQQIRYYERWVEADSTNGQAYSDLADLLREQKRYDDLIYLLKQWLKVDPTNSRITSDLISATELSGGDPLEVFRSRALDNPDNPQYGMDYAAKLIETGNILEAFRELEAVIQRSPSSTRAYELLASAAVDDDDLDRAVSAYERLYDLNRTNIKVTIDLSRTYLQKMDYDKALTWAQTALRVSNNSGEAYYARAEVYYNVADECTGQHENGVARFDDKLVFMMAHEDYLRAVERGHRRGRSRADFLGKNLIPRKGDWFLQSADIRVFKPQSSCYGWITRTVRRP